MKSFAVALCVLLALEVARGHTSEEEIQAMKDCAAEHKVKADDIKSFINTKEASKDAKCFMKCMMVAYHGMKEDGTLDAKAPMEEHGHVELAAMAEECGKKIEKTDDLCEMAFQHAVCMLGKDTDGKVKSAMMEHIDEI